MWRDNAGNSPSLQIKQVAIVYLVNNQANFCYHCIDNTWLNPEATTYPVCVWMAGEVRPLETRLAISPMFGNI
jgi:hypothetical protein